MMRIELAARAQYRAAARGSVTRRKVEHKACSPGLHVRVAPGLPATMCAPRWRTTGCTATNRTCESCPSDVACMHTSNSRSSIHSASTQRMQ